MDLTVAQLCNDPYAIISGCFLYRGLRLSRLHHLLYGLVWSSFSVFVVSFPFDQATDLWIEDPSRTNRTWLVSGWAPCNLFPFLGRLQGVLKMPQDICRLMFSKVVGFCGYDIDHTAAAVGFPNLILD